MDFSVDTQTLDVLRTTLEAPPVISTDAIVLSAPAVVAPPLDVVTTEQTPVVSLNIAEVLASVTTDEVEEELNTLTALFPAASAPFVLPNAVNHLRQFAGSGLRDLLEQSPPVSRIISFVKGVIPSLAMLGLDYTPFIQGVKDMCRCIRRLNRLEEIRAGQIIADNAPLRRHIEVVQAQLSETCSRIGELDIQQLKSAEKMAQLDEEIARLQQLRAAELRNRHEAQGQIDVAQEKLMALETTETALQATLEDLSTEQRARRAVLEEAIDHELHMKEDIASSLQAYFA